MGNDGELGNIAPNGLSSEVIVVGILMLGWVYLTLCWWLGEGWIDYGALEKWVPVLAVVLVGASYAAGVCAMVLISPVLDAEHIRDYKAVFAEQPPHLRKATGLIQVELMDEMPWLAKRHGNTLNKMDFRIAYAFSAALIGISLWGFLAFRRKAGCEISIPPAAVLIATAIGVYRQTRVDYLSAFRSLYGMYGAFLRTKRRTSSWRPGR